MLSGKNIFLLLKLEVIVESADNIKALTAFSLDLFFNVI